MISPVRMLEAMFDGMLSAGAIIPSDIACALHNVCCHGNAHEKAGFSITDKQLEKLIGRLEKVVDTMRKIEG